MKKTERDSLHRQLDEIIDWEPRFIGSASFRNMCIGWIPKTHSKILEERRKKRDWVTEKTGARHFDADLSWVRERIDEGKLRTKSVDGKTMVRIAED